MEQLSAFQITVILATLMVITVNLVNGQVRTPCTTYMMSSFTPCANTITGSINNGLKPSTTCCDSLRSLMSTSMDCACMAISANSPSFQLAINQALALSISQACNINGLPLQCKASGSPLPAPGLGVLGPNGPSLPPIAASPLSPEVSKMMVVGEEYKYENLQLAAASSPVEAEAPTRVPKIRPILTPSPSASHSSSSVSPFIPIIIAIMVFSVY